MRVLFSQSAFSPILDHCWIGEVIADGFWRFVSLGYQETYLPHLHFGERLAEARHASQANPVRDFPVTLPRLVVGHALTLEQLRRTRIQTGGNRSLVLPGHSVAYRAMLAVDPCPGGQIRLVALDGGAFIGISFRIRAFRALWASVFSKGIAASAVATGAPPVAK